MIINTYLHSIFVHHTTWHKIIKEWEVKILKEFRSQTCTCSFVFRDIAAFCCFSTWISFLETNNLAKRYLYKQSTATLCPGNYTCLWKCAPGFQVNPVYTTFVINTHSACTHLLSHPARNFLPHSHSSTHYVKKQSKVNFLLLYKLHMVDKTFFFPVKFWCDF